MATSGSPTGVEADLWSKPDETINDEQGDHDGKDIVRLAKHKIHVCWYSLDLALLGRRALLKNGGRAALGKNGLDNKVYSKKEDLIEPLDPKGKLIDHEWNKDGPAFSMGVSGHNYQMHDTALEYYLTNMKEHCDIVKC